jgi:seryl-tRNA synthetase
MLNPDFIRQNPEIVKRKLEERLYDPFIIDEFLSVDNEWKKIKQLADSKRAEKNSLSIEISKALKEGNNKKLEELRKKAQEIDLDIKNIMIKEKELYKKRNEMLLTLPNLQQDDVPKGNSENDNVEIKTYGKPEKFAEHVKPHYEIPFFDFERAAKMSGHRFALMYDKFAKLERALINFMLNINTLNGYKEVWGPHLVNTKAMEGTGQLPKFADELYKTNDDLWLIPTAEVMLVNIYRDEIIESGKLPIRLCSYTPSYRREAGAYGKDIKGFIRQHQFDKVEIVSITKQENSNEEHVKMLNDVESILKVLNLPYRVIELCTADLGFSSSKTFDIELWMPSQNKYREISSISNCLDFQARRANIRYREKGKLIYAHTLNGSALAVGRTLIAIVENYQEKDGIKIPKPLQSYMESDFIPF